MTRIRPDAPKSLVLIVEDHEDTRDLYEAVLGAAGHRVVRAASAQQALDIAAALTVDAVVIDVGLPGIDGFELARRLHDLGTRRPALLAVTGRPLEGANREGLFDAYLMKPCPPDTLIATLATCLEKRVRTDER